MIATIASMIALIIGIAVVFIVVRAIVRSSKK